jgi:hypothetical protein
VIDELAALTQLQVNYVSPVAGTPLRQRHDLLPKLYVAITPWSVTQRTGSHVHHLQCTVNRRCKAPLARVIEHPGDHQRATSPSTQIVIGRE